MMKTLLVAMMVSFSTLSIHGLVAERLIPDKSLCSSCASPSGCDLQWRRDPVTLDIEWRCTEPVDNCPCTFKTYALGLARCKCPTGQYTEGVICDGGANTILDNVWNCSNADGNCIYECYKEWDPPVSGAWENSCICKNY